MAGILIPHGMKMRQTMWETRVWRLQHAFMAFRSPVPRRLPRYQYDESFSVTTCCICCSDVKSFATVFVLVAFRCVVWLCFQDLTTSPQ